MYIKDITKQILVLEDKTYNIHNYLDCKTLPITQFLHKWYDKSNYIELQTSGSTGKPKKILANKTKMINSAVATCSFFNLDSAKTALLCMDIKYIGAMMMVVRALVCGMKLIVTAPSSSPFNNITHSIDFAAIVPLQLYNALDNNNLHKAKQVIVGGGAINTDVIKQLYNYNYNCNVYSTYGMTETLSHIALCHISKQKHIDNSINHNNCIEDTLLKYKPLKGVKISIDKDNKIIIDAPYILDKPLVTNDIGKIFEDGSFAVIGRVDNIINSGGIKLQLEVIEQEILNAIQNCKYKKDDIQYSNISSINDFALTYTEDKVLGQKLVLLITQNIIPDKLMEYLKFVLPKYHCPKEIRIVPNIPRTSNGKIDRCACKILLL